MKAKTLTLAALAAAISTASADEKILLTQFDLSDTASDRGQARVGAKFDGNSMSVGGRWMWGGHKTSLGMHANSYLALDLGEGALRFDADYAVDDKGGDGLAQFQMLLDGKVVADSGPVRRSDGVKHFSVDLRGAKKLMLKVLDGGDGIEGDHGDWFNIGITYEDGKFPPADVRSISPKQLGILPRKAAPSRA